MCGLFLTEPLPRPLGRAKDGLGASSIKALSFVGFARLFTLATDGEELHLRSVPPGRSPMKVDLRFISSNLSKSGHNSPILALDDPSGAPHHLRHGGDQLAKKRQTNHKN
jgi:hypothetical protein